MGEEPTLPRINAFLFSGKRPALAVETVVSLCLVDQILLMDKFGLGTGPFFEKGAKANLGIFSGPAMAE